MAEITEKDGQVIVEEAGRKMVYSKRMYEHIQKAPETSLAAGIPSELLPSPEPLPSRYATIEEAKKLGVPKPEPGEPFIEIEAKSGKIVKVPERIWTPAMQQEYERTGKQYLTMGTRIYAEPPAPAKEEPSLVTTPIREEKARAYLGEGKIETPYGTTFVLKPGEKVETQVERRMKELEKEAREDPLKYYTKYVTSAWATGPVSAAGVAARTLARPVFEPSLEEAKRKELEAFAKRTLRLEKKPIETIGLGALEAPALIGTGAAMGAVETKLVATAPTAAKFFGVGTKAIGAGLTGVYVGKPILGKEYVEAVGRIGEVAAATPFVYKGTKIGEEYIKKGLKVMQAEAATAYPISEKEGLKISKIRTKIEKREPIDSKALTKYITEGDKTYSLSRIMTEGEKEAIGLGKAIGFPEVEGVKPSAVVSRVVTEKPGKIGEFQRWLGTKVGKEWGFEKFESAGKILTKRPQPDIAVSVGKTVTEKGAPGIYEGIIKTVGDPDEFAAMGSRLLTQATTSSAADLARNAALGSIKISKGPYLAGLAGVTVKPKPAKVVEPVKLAKVVKPIEAMQPAMIKISTAAITPSKEPIKISKAPSIESQAVKEMQRISAQVSQPKVITKEKEAEFSRVGAMYAPEILMKEAEPKKKRVIRIPTEQLEMHPLQRKMWEESGYLPRKAEFDWRTYTGRVVGLQSVSLQQTKQAQELESAQKTLSTQLLGEALKKEPVSRQALMPRTIYATAQAQDLTSRMAQISTAALQQQKTIGQRMRVVPRAAITEQIIPITTMPSIAFPGFKGRKPKAKRKERPRPTLAEGFGFKPLKRMPFKPIDWGLPPTIGGRWISPMPRKRKSKSKRKR